VPLTVLITSVITWAIGLLEGVYCTMFGSGIVISWTYLRFYQRHSNGSRGDPAENFNFASFFPNVLQPAISVVANSMFEFFVKVGLCRKQVKRFTDSSGPSSIQISLPGSDPSDAERRRQKALKLLSERLGGGSKDDSKRPLIRPESPENDPRPGTSSSRVPGMQMNMPSSPNLNAGSQRSSDIVIPVANESPPAL